jgi:hypothetical protein
MGFAFAFDDAILATLFKYKVTSSVLFFARHDEPLVCDESPPSFEMGLGAVSVYIFFSQVYTPHIL